MIRILQYAGLQSFKPSGGKAFEPPGTTRTLRQSAARKKMSKGPKKIFDSLCLLSNLASSMNILRPSIYAIALTSLALSSVNAQTTATTDPVGFQTTAVPIGFTALGNPLVNANVVQAGVSANTDSVVTLSGVVNVGSLLTAGEPFYLEVVSGSLEGERFDLDTAATQTAANSTAVINTSSPNNTLPALSGGQLNGASVAIRKHVTLEQLQTAFSPALIGNNNQAIADQIQLFNPQTGAFTAYYLRGNGTEWRAVGGATAANKTIVAPAVGFLVRKITSASSFTSVGTVRMNDLAFPMPQGASFRAPGFPVSYSPASLGGTAANGWTGNNNQAIADQLQVFNPLTGAFTAYYLRGNGTEWRAVGGATSVTADQLFASDAPFMVLKRQADLDYILVNPVVQ
jgi:hypothetical protein